MKHVNTHIDIFNYLMCLCVLIFYIFIKFWINIIIMLINDNFKKSSFLFLSLLLNTHISEKERINETKILSLLLEWESVYIWEIKLLFA